MLLRWILALAITTGQLIRMPLGTNGAVNLLDAVVIILCLVGFFQTKLRLKKPPLFIVSALVFILIALISLILTPLHLTISEFLISLFYIVRFFLYILLGWLILSGAFSFLREKIYQVMLVSGIGLAILGLLQFIFIPDLGFLVSGGWDPHYFRTVATFLDPNFAGAYFVLTLILFMSLRSANGGVAISKRKIASSLKLLAMTAVYSALLTTFSRSSYLMFLVSGLTLSFLKKSRTFALAVIILFLGLLLGFHIYTQLVAKPRNIERGKSASARLNTWQQGFVLFSNHPALGVGFNAYRYALKQYGLADEQFISSHGASSNDSSLLFVAATTGIAGLVCYLFFLTTLFKGKNLLLRAGLSGLIIHSFFANSLFYPPILLWLIVVATTPWEKVHKK